MRIETHTSKSRRLPLLLVVVVFAGPLALAAWMYYSGSLLAPSGSTNKGALLLPIISLSEALPRSEIQKIAPDHWLMVYLNNAPCADECRESLIRLRQSRLMLGNDMHRVRRVFLHGESTPDTVFLKQQHEGLITLADKNLRLVLERKRPTELAPGGFYLIDPLGNLVMYFFPGLAPKDMVGDIHHLLKLSHIG